MTTSKIQKSGIESEVLCRGCGNRPLRRAATTQFEGAVEVVDPTSGSTSLFPARDVYVWNDRLASRIGVLLESGDDAGAEALWNSAAPYGAVPESKG